MCICPKASLSINTVKALLSPRGAYLILGPKKGGTYKRGGLNREGALISNHKFSINFTITPLTKTEQEMGYV